MHILAVDDNLSQSLVVLVDRQQTYVLGGQGHRTRCRAVLVLRREEHIERLHIYRTRLVAILVGSSQFHLVGYQIKQTCTITFRIYSIQVHVLRPDIEIAVGCQGSLRIFTISHAIVNCHKRHVLRIDAETSTSSIVTVAWILSTLS